MLRADRREDISLRDLRGQTLGGEIELCVEFPKTFEGELAYLNFSDDSTLNGFYRNDAASIEFFSGILSSNPPIPPRGLPKDVSGEVRKQFDVHADELLDTPSFLTLPDINLLLQHHQVSEDFFNPMVEATIGILRTLTARYGEKCRIVFWLHEA